MVEVRGKRGKSVPLLLTPEVSSAMDLLNEKRGEVGVPDTNIYFFAKGEHNFIRYNEVLNKLCSQIEGLKSPELITSTKLRKYTGTLSQVSYYSNYTETIAMCCVESEFCLNIM